MVYISVQGDQIRLSMYLALPLFSRMYLVEPFRSPWARLSPPVSLSIVLLPPPRIRINPEPFWELDDKCLPSGTDLKLDKHLSTQ